MKRSSALAPLSRDHQHALYAALQLRRADDDGAAAALTYFAQFFETEGRRHFEIEETLLVPSLPADDPEWAPAVGRVLADHAAIRAAADDIAGLTADSARVLGERLTAHVRFEENVLFEILERRLPAGELAELGAAVEAAEQRSA